MTLPLWPCLVFTETVQYFTAEVKTLALGERGLARGDGRQQLSSRVTLVRRAWPLWAAGGQQGYWTRALGFPRSSYMGGRRQRDPWAQAGWHAQRDLVPGLPYFFVGRGGVQGSGEGLPRAACLYGGMSGMFGIWVFTSQGARGSLVLKSVSFTQGEGPSGPGQSWI